MHRARLGPRRVLSLLFYATSKDLPVPEGAIQELYRLAMSGDVSKWRMAMASNAEEPKHYLVQRIREALAHDPRVVRGSKVFVAGAVPTEDRRQAVTEVVQESAPDHEVHNETRASFRPGAVEEEELG